MVLDFADTALVLVLLFIALLNEIVVVLVVVLARLILVVLVAIRLLAFNILVVVAVVAVLILLATLVPPVVVHVLDRPTNGPSETHPHASTRRPPKLSFTTLLGLGTLLFFLFV